MRPRAEHRIHFGLRGEPTDIRPPATVSDSLRDGLRGRKFGGKTTEFDAVAGVLEASHKRLKTSE